MTTKKATLTWPDLLNELYGNGIIQQIPPQSGILLHAILYRFNQNWFKSCLNMPNGDLQTLSNLTSKQFYKSRTILIDKINPMMREEYEFASDEPDFLVYQSSGSSNYSGRYYLNATPIIRRLAGERQGNHRRLAGDTQENDEGLVGDMQENGRRLVGEPNANPIPYQSPESLQKGDHNNTIQQNENKTLNKILSNNNNNLNEIPDVVESEEDFIFNQEKKAMVYEDLVLYDMPQIDIDKYFDNVKPYHIMRAYNETKKKYDQNKVENFIGYFKGIIERSTGYKS